MDQLEFFMKFEKKTRPFVKPTTASLKLKMKAEERERDVDQEKVRSREGG
jgi:hypothetical protein